MITDNSNGRLNNITAHVKKHGPAETLQQVLSQLTKLSDGFEINYFSDPVPLAIKLTITKDGKDILRGGLVFPHDNENEAEPSFYIYFLQE